MIIRILFAVLVLSALALVTVALAVFFHVRGHMKSPSATATAPAAALEGAQEKPS